MFHGEGGYPTTQLSYASGDITILLSNVRVSVESRRKTVMILLFTGFICETEYNI